MSNSDYPRPAVEVFDAVYQFEDGRAKEVFGISPALAVEPIQGMIDRQHRRGSRPIWWWPLRPWTATLRFRGIKTVDPNSVSG